MTFSSKSCLQMNRSICTITRQTHDRRIVLLGLSKRKHWESSIVQTVLSSPDHVRPKISSNKSAGSAHCSLDLFGESVPISCATNSAQILRTWVHDWFWCRSEFVPSLSISLRGFRIFCWKSWERSGDQNFIFYGTVAGSIFLELSRFDPASLNLDSKLIMMRKSIEAKRLNTPSISILGVHMKNKVLIGGYLVQIFRNLFYLQWAWRGAGHKIRIFFTELLHILMLQLFIWVAKSVSAESAI